MLDNLTDDSSLYLMIAIIASVGFLTGKCDCRSAEQLEAIYGKDKVEQAGGTE